MANSDQVRGGGCLCGAVRFRVRGPLRGVVNCHCGQCRRTHGHYAAYTEAPWAAVAFDADAGLGWFESSAEARRGFCRQCGASLFWERVGADAVSIAAGSLDQPSGLTTVGNIFVADKADYYDLPAGLPGHDGTMSPR